MRVEIRTSTVYTLTHEEYQWLEEAGIFDFLMARLNSNERIEIEQS